MNEVTEKEENTDDGKHEDPGVFRQENQRFMVGNTDLSLAEAVNEVFRYHSPTDEQVERINEIRVAAKLMATAILRVCPHGADRSAAMRKLREVMMTANAAIMVPGARF